MTQFLPLKIWTRHAVLSGVRSGKPNKNILECFMARIVATFNNLNRRPPRRVAENLDDKSPCIKYLK